MKIENIEVYGLRAALRGLRNPHNSWAKSDTTFAPYNLLDLRGSPVFKFQDKQIICLEFPAIGPKDMALAKKLIAGGPEHRKFLRQIIIWFDITIPRYVWTELDTYKVATVRNSCSTMHKLGGRNLHQEDFEEPIPNLLLLTLNELGNQFRNAKLKKFSELMNTIRRQYKNLLPEGFLQKATYMMSYETALSMYFQRKNHRLPEWNITNPESICSFIASLPYMKEFLDILDKE